MRRNFFIAGFLMLLIGGCGESRKSLFTSLEPGYTGIEFNNYIEETDSFNIIFDEYIYNGGGVGVGDFNNDGLQDLYFTGNNVSNRLYLNLGNFRFVDITEKAGVGAEDIWTSGISVVDINNDGWMDMYLSATFKQEDGTRKNKLYINQGITDGVPVFIDKAADYGIDDDGHTTHGVFFDYDLDGDLDLYNLTNVFLGKRAMGSNNLKVEDRSQTIDKLYRNEGNGRFSDISQEAGIVLEGFGLGIAILDVNKDGYPDLYISNDFISSDILYVNNGDGTFTNKLEEYFKHISFASMGNDASDFNNDGLIDIMTLEMLPSDNRNLKMMYNTTVFNRDRMIRNAGYYTQFLRNCLQYNNGNGTFSDISFLLGISDTDWSWSTLFADFDNDGFRDLAIANGFPRNVTDKDYVDQLMMSIGLVSNPRYLLQYIPEYKSRNFFFKNLSGEKFEDVSESWGIQEVSFSNGAAFVDLDNDGDPDYVTNNINDAAFIFRNNAEKFFPARNWIKIKLKGKTGNVDGIGSRISVYYDGKVQYYEHFPFRGYISTVDPVIHFGLDTCTIIDSLNIVWPTGEYQSLHNVPVNQVKIISISDAANNFNQHKDPEKHKLFREMEIEPSFKHHEEEFMEFQIQPLLPHLHSRLGPGMAVGDLNADGVEDLVIANGRNADIALLIQGKDGSYENIQLSDTADVEVTGVLLFDSDNDQDLDLYAVSGGSEFHKHSHHFRDRLFRNDGEGHFIQDPEAIPEIYISGSLATAADYDRDGDLDVFVAGRVIPQAYPLPERSILLENKGGTFEDVTEKACREFMDLGMVSSALWTDFDQDGWTDLIVAGEWMPIRIFRNREGRFIEVTEEAGLAGSEGWWNSISSIDYDLDGDLDYILGNQGLNNRYTLSPEKPLKMIAADFDNNGIIDPVISAWQNDHYYPVHLRNDMISQILFLKNRFPGNIDYSRMNTSNLFTEEELKGALEIETRIFESVIIRQEGNQKFTIIPLPFQAQFAPVKGILTDDFDYDGIEDVLMIGNNYPTESFSGAHDAFIGLFLKGNGHGNLISRCVTETGFFVDGDGRALVTLFDVENNRITVAAQNAGKLKFFLSGYPGDGWVRFKPGKMDRMVKLLLKDGSIRIRELYYGSSYLSQSSRDVLINKYETEKIEVIDYLNNSRAINSKDL